jgi:hypothetical protein
MDIHKTRSIILGTVIMTYLVLAILAGRQQLAWAWILGVDLSHSQFGSSKVCASVEAAYGYGPVDVCTSAGRNAKVTFNIEDSIGQGENYMVCVWDNVAGAIFKNCQYFSHGSGDETVSLPVGR